jgi:hypothetical protein
VGLRVHIDQERADRLSDHLARGADEQLAFMLAAVDGDEARVIDLWLIEDASFDIQTPWHLSLGDDTLGDVIRWAHAASASLIEAHVHRDGDPARFSLSDWAGLDAFVPHAFWRLRHRPYVALVFGEATFDGLVWRQDATIAEPVESLFVDGQPPRLPTVSSRRPTAKS